MSVTVVIPGYKHAELLRTTLESIQRQTAIAAIDSVIVSENSEDTQTLETCNLFPGLPIRYVQNPGIEGMVAHWSWIFEQADTALVAMLHDDDWWYPTHLENALQAFQQEKINAYFSNFIFAGSEQLNNGRFHFLELGILEKPLKDPFSTVYLDFNDIITLSYLYTPFHTSCMVARKEQLALANSLGLRKSDGWNADRSLYPYLALNGNIAFNPQLLAAVRSHSNQFSSRLAKANQQDNFNKFAGMSEAFITLGKENGIDVLKNWENIKAKSQPEQWNRLVDIFKIHYGNNYPSSLFTYNKVEQASLKRLIKNSIKAITPFGLLKALQNRDSNNY